MQTLQGRTCVFAGASGGDGVSAVHALCRAGMNVIMMTHQPAQAQRLLDEIASCGYPGKCAAVQDGKAQNPPVPEEEVFRQAAALFGSIDVIISNTGADGYDDSIDTVSPEQLMRSVEHLLGGSYRMLKCALPWLRKSTAPRAIFMTTVEGARGGRLESFSKAVAKGAVLSMARNCAARLASEGITVNCILKGAIERLPEPPRPDGPKLRNMHALLPLIPLGRMGTPEDLAGALCFLASEESAYVTGTVLDLSGGLSLV